MAAATRTSWSKIAALERSAPGKGRVLNMKSPSKSNLSAAKEKPKSRIKSSTSGSKTTARYTPSQASGVKKPGNYDTLMQAIKMKYGVDNIEKMDPMQLVQEIMPHLNESVASKFE